MTERRIKESALLRGGPEWDYPCNNPHMIECASSHCQVKRRCRLKEYFALNSADGEKVESDAT